MPTTYNKVVAGNQTLIDLSQDTVTQASHIMAGYVGHLADGTQVTGTGQGGGGGAAITIADTLDANGGTIRTITAVDISSDTITAAHLESGYTAHDAAGNAVTGSLTPGITPTGTKTITQNGTGIDVTQYAAVDVAVPATAPNLQAKTNISPTESSQTIEADSDYDGLSSVQINGVSSNYVGSAIDRRDSTDLTASGATVTAPAGYYASDATKSVASGSVTAPGTISGSSASVSAGTNTITLTKTVSVTPNVTAAGYISSGTAGDASVSLTASVNTRTSSDLTASGATVTAPAGYYANAATKSVSSGTEGTPTATKGTVSNHSVTVTPSVTNAAGYITGGTKTGTAVTVSASELVSGSETKTANGTYDVTNLAELVVNVSASGGKNGQLQSRVARTSQTTYTDMGFEITVSKAGKYNIYWAGYRSSTSGTSGAQIYINDTAYGSAQTTFNSSYSNCQTGEVSNVTLAVDDKVTIRARARNTSSYMYIYNLAIIEV